MLFGTEPRAGQYLLLRLAAPDQPLLDVGVCLLDPAGSRCDFKLRDDLADLPPELEWEEREALRGLAGQIAAEVHDEGAEAWLRRAEDSLSNILRLSDRQPVAIRDFGYQLNRLFDEHVLGLVRESGDILPFVRHLPVYSLRAAAGKFGEDMEVEPEGWVEAPEGMRLTADLFVAHVTGHSMEPEIPDGCLAVFRARPAGTRQGMRVLVWRPGAQGNEFTLKVYKSRKAWQGEDWEHESITLQPLNPEYEALELDPGTHYEVLGQFLRVL